MNESTGSGSAPRESRLRRLRGSLRGVGLFAAGLCAAFGAIFLYHLLLPGPRPLTTQDVNLIAAQAMASATPPPAYSERVYQAIQPSLVLIQTKLKNPTNGDDSGLGTGVIIDDRGDIMTSLHVVADAAAIQLTFADGTQSNGSVTTQQPENDIAVLRADQSPAQIVPATLGNPRSLHTGDEAYVVGNPFGLYSSMTAGVISGFNRSFQPPNSSQTLRGLIQIDAAVNPGNSGGPLLNRDGQVVGIVTGIVNPTGQDVFIGIGFAVPINIAGGALGSPID